MLMYIYMNEFEAHKIQNKKQKIISTTLLREAVHRNLKINVITRTRKLDV